MLFSRLVSAHHPSLKRTLVTQARIAVSKENKDEQKTSNDDDASMDTPFDPPRRPLTQQFTHQVTNQVPPLEYQDLYKNDLVLRDFVTKENHGQIKDMGAELGVFHWFEQGHQANRYPPALHQFDRYGQRIDEVHFHPAYHELMQIGMRYGVSDQRSTVRPVSLFFCRFIPSPGNRCPALKLASILTVIYNML